MSRFSRFCGTVIAVVGCCAVILMVTSAGAQTSSRIGRSPYKDGKPDFSGTWQAMNTANWNLLDHGGSPAPVLSLGAWGAVPPGFGIVEGNEIPYRPEALSKLKENVENRLARDPEVKCYVPGVPRAMYMPYPFQIVQTPTHLLMSFQYANAARMIHFQDKPDMPVDTWMGYSTGRWESDALVIDSQGFNDQSWFDRAGNYHSDALHVVERITPLHANALQYEATIEDQKVFTRPWKLSMTLYRRIGKDAELLEFNCVEYVEEMMYGDLVKKGTP